MRPNYSTHAHENPAKIQNITLCPCRDMIVPRGGGIPCKGHYNSSYLLLIKYIILIFC